MARVSALTRSCASILAAIVLATASSWAISSASASAKFITEPPKVTAQAVYAIDVTAGVELYSVNADEERSPASITKLAAAVVVVDHIPDLTQSVTIEESDIAPLASDESRMGLEAGDVLTMQDLLDGMLIHSGSDAAYAAARVTGDTLLAGGAQAQNAMTAFIDAMNGFATELGLKHTHFTNPVGIDEKGHYSSARDLATLSKAALERPVIAETVDIPSLQTQIGGVNPREVTLENTNQLLGESIHGVKTGSTGDAGACVVLAKWEGGSNRLILVVLGSKLAYDNDGFISTDKRWDDANAIFSAIDRDLTWVSPSDTSALPGLQEELSAWQVALKDSSSVVVPTSDKGTLRYLLQLGPAGQPNTEVGHVLFFVGSEKIAEKPVFQAPTT